ncbi:MAG TPA: ornithine carbamoyltransferase [Candidatus Aquicultor sp.]|jgi:ornithine carbamoyltransferase
MTTLTGRHILSLKKYSPDELNNLLGTAVDLKSKIKNNVPHKMLEGKTVAMLFDKPSSRTRISFETACAHTGAHPIFLRPDEVQVGKREPIQDVGRVLSGYVDAIVIRTFEHKNVEQLAEFSSVPVINALTDEHHPMQALADYMTVLEVKARLNDIKLAYVGDGNNVANSLLIVGAKLGVSIAVASPEGYEPSERIIARAKLDTQHGGQRITVTNDPYEAVKDADVIYTDVWASMGQEEEYIQRLNIFKDYQVNSALMAAAKPAAVFMHCLPAHRGEEVTDEVVESAQSVVFQQAENRLHTAKAALVSLIKRG